MNAAKAAAGVSSGNCNCATCIQAKNPINLLSPIIPNTAPLPSITVEDEPDIIAEIEGWRMDTADSMLIPWLYNTCSVLSHFCPKTGWRQFLSPDDVLDAKACTTCGTLIPDSVLTVWHLWNADEILKYSKKIQKYNKPDKVEELTPMIWETSGPILIEDLFDDGPFIYSPSGELLNDEETVKWPGNSHVVLFDHDDKMLDLGDDKELVG